MKHAPMPGSLRQKAESLREEIEELLLGCPESDLVLLEALRAAEAGINRYFEHGPNDEGIAALDSIRLALSAAGKASDEERAEALHEATRFADELRARSLDQLTAADTGGAQIAYIFRASHGTPAAHVVLDIPPPELISKRAEDEPPDLEALLAEEESMAFDVPERPPIRIQIERLGRDAMEDLAILGGLRRLNADERWTDGRGFEERLLANLDALWSLDLPVHKEAPKLDVPMALYRYATEWSFPDWGRAFALAFGMACVESETALRWIVLAARRADPAVLSAYVEALSLGSNPGIDRTATGELAADNHQALMLAWLDVALRRRVFDARAMLPLLAHPEAAVRVAAARCFRAAPRELALATLPKLKDEPEIGVAIADELVARGDATALRALRSHAQQALAARAETLTEDLRTALLALAISAEPQDDALLLHAAQALATGPYFLGFVGRPMHVEFLLDELDGARKLGAQAHARAEACARALHRMLALEPEAPVEELRRALRQDTAWQRHSRLRLGRAHHVSLVVGELLAPRTRQGERRDLVRELAYLTPEAPRLDIDGWIARQQADLGALLAMVEPSRPSGG